MATKFKFGAHLSEETLEEYAFGRVLEPEAASIEEHLLVCEQCQDTLGDIDEYILLMKAATREQAPLPALVRPKRRLAPYVAAGTIAAGVAVAALLPSVRPVRPAETVELQSLRGVEMPRIHADHPADLRITVPDLPDAPYRVEVVDASGGTVWSGRAVASGRRIRVLEPKALRAGAYWVRLYSENGELLREFGLESS